MISCTNFGQDRSMTIQYEEPLPRAASLLVPPVLDRLGVDELNHYIKMLKDEIGRVESTIKARRAHLDAASALFKTPPSSD